MILVLEGMAKISKKRKVKINDSYDGMIVGLSILRSTVSRGDTVIPGIGMALIMGLLRTVF